MKKTTFKQCTAGDVFEHQEQALIKTTKPNTAVNLNSGAFAHFHNGSLVDRSDLVLIHQAGLPSEMPNSLKGDVVMKNENAIMDRIKTRIAYHSNEHRHTYEIGKDVMDFLARDLLSDFKAAGTLFPPVALDGGVYVIYRRKPVKAKVIFIGINADRLFFFNVLHGNIKANFQTYQFTENDIGRGVFLTLEEAEKAVS